MISVNEIISAQVKGFEYKVIFDVGANDGSVAKKFSALAPNAKVYAFEPVAETYAKAAEKLSPRQNVEVFNLALGAEPGTALMQIRRDSRMNRISPESGDREVEVTTIDRFCEQNKIDHISYLKIDTEGHDLQVVIGAQNMLKNVDFIECEVSMNKHNRFHIPFEDIRDFMDKHDFALFWIYEMAHEWSGGGKPLLRRANVVFVSPTIYGDLSQTIRS